MRRSANQGARLPEKWGFGRKLSPLAPLRPFERSPRYRPLTAFPLSLRAVHGCLSKRNVANSITREQYEVPPTKHVNTHLIFLLMSFILPQHMNPISAASHMAGTKPFKGLYFWIRHSMVNEMLHSILLRLHLYASLVLTLTLKFCGITNQ